MSLELHDIGFGYGDEKSTGGASASGPRAGGVQGINLQVADSELLAVMGPSGCGKSTLLKLCAGLLAPTQGRITLDGKDITHLPPHRRCMGVVFQGYALFPHMTVADNVGYGLRVRGDKGPALAVKVDEMLALVGLSAFAHQQPAQLSGGQQQRVALARALCIKPRALLLDEPLSALDASLRGPLRDEIKRLQRLACATAVFVTHDPAEALELADKVAVMASGQVLQCAAPQTVYEQPANAEVARLTGLCTVLHAQVQAGDSVRVHEADAPPWHLACKTKGFAVGDAVQVMVRPEHVLANPPQGMPNRFDGQVLRTRYQGSRTVFDFAAQGAGLITVDATGPVPRSVALDPSTLHLMPDT